MPSLFPTKCSTWPPPAASFEEFERLHVFLTNVSLSYKHFDRDHGGARALLDAALEPVDSLIS